MERRGFLKLLGLGAVTAAVAATVGVEEAMAAPKAAANETKSVDQFLNELTDANKGDGEFAQYYYYRRRPRYVVRRRYYRPRYYRPRYYYRPRRCGWYATPWGRVWRCA